MYENDFDVDVPTADELLAELGLDVVHDPQAARRGGRRSGVL